MNSQPAFQGNSQPGVNGAATPSIGVIDQAFANYAQQNEATASSFTEDEQELLSLYDRLHELQLETALLESQNTDTLEADTLLSDQQIQDQIKVLERECLEARSAYLLKDTIVESVILADPTLKAVHSGTNANPTEKALHPLLDQRDVLSVAHANLSTSLHSTLVALSSAELQHIACIAKNRGLTTTLLDLTRRLKAQNSGNIDDPDVRAQLDRLSIDGKEVKRRWRMLKSVVATMIAASGVDWARDDELRDFVLDDED